MKKYHLHSTDINHSHDDDHHANHPHTHEINYKQIRSGGTKVLKWIMIVTLSFAFVEAIGGYYANSLALMSDAVHMFTDSFSILLALWMAKISQLPADKNHSYGHGRADTIGALLNSLFMFVVIGFIVYEAIQRIISPSEVDGLNVLIIATVGGLMNGVALFFLQKHTHSLNTRGAFLHVIGDLLGSIATVIAGLIIYIWGWNIVDPILSIVVCLILIPTAYQLSKKSIHILMEGVPEHLNYEKVGDALSKVDGIVSIHDLHIWTMNADTTALSSHVLIKNMKQWDNVLLNSQKMLAEKFNIIHITLQPEVIKEEIVHFKIDYNRNK